MKKLYRITDPDKKKIAGICAGIGEIYNFDPNLVRIVFVFVCVITHFIPLIAAYVAGWIIIPEKPYLPDMKEENIT